MIRHLRELLDTIFLYWRYVLISIRGQMEYRASFVMQSLGQFMVTGIDFLGMWALFDRFDHLRQWKLPEVALFYGVINIAFAMSDAMCRGFDEVGLMIKGGEFDRILLRPRSVPLQLAGQGLTLRRVGRLLQGLMVFLWASNAIPVVWTPDKMILIALTLVGGVSLFYGLFVLQGTLAFWTTETLEIMNAVTYGGVETGQYPIPVYRSWFRKFFTFVIPLACISYFPILAVLQKPDPLGTGKILQYTAPMAGVLFLTISLQFLKLGVRRYSSTGS